MAKAQHYFYGKLTTWTRRSEKLPHKVRFGHTEMTRTQDGVYRRGDGFKFVTTTTLLGDLFSLVSGFAKRRQDNVTLLVESFTLRVLILAGIIPMDCEKESANEKYGLAMIFKNIRLNIGEETIEFDVKIHTRQPVYAHKARSVARDTGCAFFDVSERHVGPYFGR